MVLYRSPVRPLPYWRCSTFGPRGTDGNGSIRTVLFYYRKAFDLIDHSILVRTLSSLDLPVSIVNWIIDFLSHRSQRIKLTEGCMGCSSFRGPSRDQIGDVVISNHDQQFSCKQPIPMEVCG